MSKLRWTLDASFGDAARQFRVSEPGEYDVPDDAVEDYLAHRSGGWERVDDDGDEEADVAAESASAESDDAEDSADDEADSKADADADGFDLEAFLDRSYTDRADAVEAGEVDAHLDAIDAEETSQTVTDAIDARREALAAESEE